MITEKKWNRSSECRGDAAAILSNTRGLSTVEYLILLVVIAVASVSVWKQIGGKVNKHAQDSNNALGDLTITPSN